MVVGGRVKFLAKAMVVRGGVRWDKGCVSYGGWVL